MCAPKEAGHATLRRHSTVCFDRVNNDLEIEIDHFLANNGDGGNARADRWSFANIVMVDTETFRPTRNGTFIDALRGLVRAGVPETTGPALIENCRS
jgi:hypothetical protein